MNSSTGRPSGRSRSVFPMLAIMAVALPAWAAGGRSALAPRGGAEARDDAYRATTNQPLIIVAPGVLTNDTATSTNQLVAALSAPPAHGTVSLSADGGFEYTPDAGFVGLDSFRYTLMGGGNGYATGAGVWIEVAGPADLALTSAASSPTVSIGSPVTFTFVVVNHGPSPAANVVLEAALPGATTGMGGDPRCGVTLGTSVECRLGSLAAGGSTQASFTLVPSLAGQLTASASVTSDTPDPDGADNTSSASTLAGDVTFDPDRVVIRVPWGHTGSASDEYGGLRLSNDTPSAMGWDVQVLDRSQKGFVARWLSVTPSSGSVSPFSSDLLALEPGGLLAPGLHRGLLRFQHDSPFAVPDVLVSLTVAFTDVDAEDEADPFIHALAGAGVTAGCDAGAFCPKDGLTRGSAAIWLLLSKEGGAYEPPPAKGLFSDIDDPIVAAFAEELARRAVVAGCAPGRFCPDDQVTRGQAAVMILSLLEGPKYLPPAAASVGQAGHPELADWLREAIRRNLLAVCSGGSADASLPCVDRPLSRAEAAMALVRAFDIPLE